MTPHNMANKGDFAQTVLMPGDPKRAQFIAENFLESAVLVNNIRGISGYTGFYKGKRVSVMASGMGIPSMGVYSYELFHFYDVQRIIRIGTAGAVSYDLHKNDIVLGMASSYHSSFMDQFDFPGSFAPCADFKLLLSAYNQAVKMGLNCHVGPIVSSDCFYNVDNYDEKWRNMGILAKEMESAALYSIALQAGREALCICTITDVIFEGREPECCTADEREHALKDMILLALEIA